MYPTMVSDNRIKNRVTKELESVFDHTLNGDAVKDKNYMAKYGAALRHCYAELEEYRLHYKSIKQSHERMQQPKRRGSAKGTNDR